MGSVRHVCCSLAPLAILLIGGTARAQSHEPPSPPTMSSTYIKFADCDFLPGPGGGLECSGLEGYQISRGSGGVGDMTSIRTADATFHRVLERWQCPERAGGGMTGGDVLEVRRADGVPVAVIMRTTCEDIDGRRVAEFLGVVGLSGHEFLDATVDVSASPNANVEARELADREAALTPLSGLFGPKVVTEEDKAIPAPAEILRLDSRLRTTDPAAHLAWCHRLVGVQPSPTDALCEVRPSGNREAVLVVLQQECGGDRCSVLAWAIRQSGRRLRLVGDVPWALTPGGDAVFTTYPMLPIGSAAYSVPSRTLRIDLGTSAIRAFAPCFSPSVSPGGKWVLCRTEDGDVLKVPASGGTAQTAWDSGLTRNYIVWHALIFPEPVTFVGADRAHVDVWLEGGQQTRVELAWQEQSGRLSRP